MKETGDVLRQLASSLGVTLVGLNQALERATPDNPRWSDVWTQDWSNEWLSVRLGFEPLTYYLDDASKGYREMKSHAVLTIEWKPTEIGPTYREMSIMPPKGYEHVSMDIPSSDLVKKAQASTDPSLAHLRYPDETQRQAILATTPTPVPNPRAMLSLIDSAQPGSSTPWITIIAAALAGIGLLWVLLKRRSRK